MDNNGAGLFDRILRIGGVVSTVALLLLLTVWFADRMRGVGFAPYTVTPCEGTDCIPHAGPYRDSPWSRYTDAIDELGFRPFAQVDHCAWAGELLETQASGQSVDLVLDLMQSRGTVRLTQVQGGVEIAPGPRNDHWTDALRDMAGIGAPRGCYPSRYGFLIWGVFLAWMLVTNLAVYRKGTHMRNGNAGDS